MRAIRTSALVGFGALALLAIGAGTDGREAPARGAADDPAIGIAPDSLDFGERLVATITADTVVVANGGTGDLILGELTVDDSDFSVGGPSGGIPPGTVVPPAGQLPVPVLFRPTRGDSILATLTIPSNDPVNPSVSVALIGFGLTDPPTLTVVPDSLGELVEVGGPLTIVRDLILANTGDVPLDFAIAALPAGAAGGGPAPRGTDDLAGVRILWDRTHGQNTWLGNTDDFVADLEARGALVDERLPQGGGDQITAAVLSGYSAYWSTDATVAWTAGEIAALAAWVRAGGGVLLSGDRLASLSWYDDLLRGIGTSIRFGDLAAVGDQITTNIPGRLTGHPTCAGVNSIYVGPGAKSLDSLAAPADSLVKDGPGRHVAAAEVIAAGRVVVISDELLENAALAAGPDNLTFGRQIFDWFASDTWVSVDPAAGSVPRDTLLTVAVTIDATGLLGGEHDLNLRVFSNDPVRPEVDVPVHLMVEGVPDLDVSPVSFAFGSVPVQTSSDTTLVLRNLGSETLLVEALSTLGSSFQVDFGPLTILGGAADTVDVTYSPTAIGPESGSVTLISNSGGGPEPDSLVVPWQGTGGVNCQLPCVAPSLRPASVEASHGYRFWLDFTLTDNPTEFRDFGFQVEYDAGILTLADSLNVRGGDLTPSHVLVATENEPGRVSCGGFWAGGPPIEAGATGTLLSLYFAVDCSTCVPGNSGEILVDELVDGLVGVNPCCGQITIAACPNGDGDINGDERLDVTDALCALEIWANGEAVPDDPDCIANGECEVSRADTDCSGVVTPGDAGKIFEHVVCDLVPQPAPCLGTVAPDSLCLDGAAPAARGDGAGAVALRWGAPREGTDGTVVFPVEAAAAIPGAFGIEVGFDESAWEWIGAERGLVAADWAGFAAAPSGEGRARVGGFRGGSVGGAGEEGVGGAERGGTLAALILRPRTGARPAIRVETVFDATFEGPREIRPSAGNGPPPVAGLEAVGPTPGRSIGITFGVLRAGADVRLTIHDVAGRRVRTLAAGPRGLGRHEVRWDGRDGGGRTAAAGIYFVRLVVGDEVWTRKVALLR